MTAAPLLVRVVLTVAFVAAGGFCLRRCLAGIGRGDLTTTRIDDAWHVVMTTLMIATLWVAPRFPGWQAAVLAVACGWFAMRAVARTPVMAAAGFPTGTATRAPGCSDEAHRGRRLRCAHHATLMALSSWMIAMPALSGDHAGMGMPVTATTAGVIVPAAYCIGVSGLLLLGFLRGRGELAHAVMAAGMGAMFVGLA